MERKKKKEKTAKINVFKVWYKSCGICAAFCPTGALGVNEIGQPVVKDPEKCTGCG